MGTKLSQSLNLVAVSLVVGLVLGMSPVGAHINNNVGHVFNHMKARVDREVVHKFAAASSESPKSLLVTCPGEEKVALGGGVSVGGSSGQPDAPPEVAVSTSELVEAPDTGGGSFRGWYGVAVETTPTDADWSLSVDVICANL